MEFFKSSMPDTEYLQRAEAVLAVIESAIDVMEPDIDLERVGNVLTLQFENGTKIIVNLQRPMQEIWLATKIGGFHFKYNGSEWRDTRNDQELFAALSEYATQQARARVVFRA